LVASLGLRVYQRDKLSIFPELLYTRSGSKNVLNAGFITQYDLKAYSESKAFLNIITKYVLGRSGIIGLQLYRENLTIGLSYDFPVIVTNVANTGAVEVGVELRKLVIPRKRNKNRKKTKASVQASRKQLAKKPVIRTTKDASNSADTSVKIDTVAAKPIPGQDLSSRLKHKQDSVRTNVEPGKFRHEPLILEKATLDFTFGFNSAEVNDQTARYLDDLAKALRDNLELRLRLVGHTDNIGSDKFNLKLSFSRAQKIKDYLVARGIGDSRISIEGKGMGEPLNDNSTQEKRALNRRVELTILYDN
jgi:outer membrane protein OmpA-like peptidoglycan-associated protein